MTELNSTMVRQDLGGSGSIAREIEAANDGREVITRVG